MTVPVPAGEEPVLCVCGRPLTDPVSRARKLGPRCYRRLRGQFRARFPAHLDRGPDAIPDGQLALDYDGDVWWDGVYQVIPSDLWGQGIARHRLYTITDVPLVGSYL